MRWRVWLTAAVVGAVGAGAGIWQITAQVQDSIDVSSIPESAREAPIGATPIKVGDEPLPPIATPTPTPDLSHAVSPDTALAQLEDISNIGDAIRSITSGNVQALGPLVQWEPMPCGSPRGSTAPCPPGVNNGAELPMVNVGWPVPFWVTDTMLDTALAEVVSDGAVTLSFASTKDGGQRADVYYVGFSALDPSPAPSPIWGTGEEVDGLFLVLQESTRPVLAIHFLTQAWGALAQAYGLGLDQHTILTLAD